MKQDGSVKKERECKWSIVRFSFEKEKMSRKKNGAFTLKLVGFQFQFKWIGKK